MKKISGKGAVIATKGFTLFVSNEDVNDIINIIKSLDDSGVLIDGVTESAKDKIKKTKTPISFSHFNSATSDFFSSKRYKWKGS